MCCMYVYACVCLSMYVCVYLYVCICVGMHVYIFCVYVYVCMYLCACLQNTKTDHLSRVCVCVCVQGWDAPEMSYEAIVEEQKKYVAKKVAERTKVTVV